MRYLPAVTLYEDSNRRVLSQCQLYVLNKGKKKKRRKKIYLTPTNLEDIQQSLLFFSMHWTVITLASYQKNQKRDPEN